MLVPVFKQFPAGSVPGGITTWGFVLGGGLTSYLMIVKLLLLCYSYL